MPEIIRAENTVSRYGGEEFLLVMPDSKFDVVLKRANQLLEKTRDLTLTHKNKSLGHVTLSIGVAIFPEQWDTSISIVSIADKALYKARTNGRDQVQVADLNMAMDPDT